MGKRYTDEQIAEALLSTGSSKGAARMLGCSAITVRKRKQSERFQQIFQAAKDEGLKETVAELRNGGTTAARTLMEVARGAKSEQVRATASNMLLSQLRAYTDAEDILERLERLEAAERNQL